MKFVYLVALFMAVVSGAGAGALEEEKPRIYCGRHLATMRVLYCFGVTENMRKRSNINTSPIIELLRPQKTKVWDPVVSALFDVVATQSKRFGIVDECCLKPCYISDLLNYC